MRIPIKILFIVVLVLYSLCVIQPVVSADEPRFYELRDTYNPFRFYNPLTAADLSNYPYYYKLTYFGTKITKFEFYEKGVVPLSGEYAWMSDYSCVFTLKTLEKSITGAISLKPAFAYEISVMNGQISEYTVYKYPQEGDKFKIGVSKFSFDQTTSVETILNYFGSLLVARIETLLQQGNIIERKIIDSSGHLKEHQFYKNNRIWQKKIYKYNPDGSVASVTTVDAQGNPVSGSG